MSKNQKQRSTDKGPSSEKKRQGKSKSPMPNDAPNSGESPVDGPYPYEEMMKKRLYYETLEKLQIELLRVQDWVKREGQKIIIVFEGRDAAGKGGTIKRFREHLNPRGARLVALSAPDDTERGQWYFQRYVANLPTHGEIVFFDRSWYNRAGVEPVMGFCTPQDYQRFIHQVSGFEQAIIESGVHLFKLWFDVGRKEQRERIKARESDPLKRWKISPMDYESMKRWDDYTKARDGMFLYTNTGHAPWTIIRSNDKKRARIGAMLTVLNALPYPEKDTEVVQAPDPLIVGSVDEMISLEGRFMFADDQGN
jgi:polyphosphate kinase 2